MSIAVHASSNESTLRRFNNVLTIIVVLLGLYLIVTPLWPQVSFFIRHKINSKSITVNYGTANVPLPSDNRIVIPQMDLDARVYDGQYADTLTKGIWRRPKTSTPDKGGNTVLVAHRFTYRSPAVFYHLDKVKKGDEFSLFWQGKKYQYKVRDVRVVEPSETQIENNTDAPILTLYTCTPIWTSKQRLVVISDRIEG